MPVRKIKDDVFYVGTIDWDRRLFDELIPLPDGTSYNSYLIIGSEKTALIDATDIAKKDDIIKNLSELGVQKIDYVIAHHAEQDHCGAIPKVLEKFPMSKVLTNAKCKGMLIDHLLIPADKFIEVSDGEKVSLGNKTLEFIFTPWVHWPETMITHLHEGKILFTCDFFGSHLATSDLFVEDKAKVYFSAKRYYAEIMMPFRQTIRKHIERVEKLDIEMIAPSHGPIHGNPSFIIDAYKDWTSDDVKNEVVLAYVSMHGSTEAAIEYFCQRVINKGITLKRYKITSSDIGALAMALVDTATIIVGSPTVHAGAHPAAAYAAFLVNALRPKAKFASIIGSYGWGGKMVEQLASMLPNLKVEIIEPVIAKGFPKEEDFRNIDRLVEDIEKKHRSIGILS